MAQSVEISQLQLPHLEALRGQLEEMYVPGTLEDIKSVMVDIGTGYFAEKNLKDAEEYFQRKMDYATAQIEKLQPVLIEKHKMRQAVIETMNAKIQAQLQSQGVSQAAS